MVIEFSLGKIIATQREIVIKLTGEAMVTLQAQHLHFNFLVVAQMLC